MFRGNCIGGGGNNVAKAREGIEGLGDSKPRRVGGLEEDEAGERYGEEEADEDDRAVEEGGEGVGKHVAEEITGERTRRLRRVALTVCDATTITFRERNNEYHCRSVVPPIFLPPTTLVLPSHSGRIFLFDTSMALNGAQLLVHDEEALAQFRVDHRIPKNVVIERPGPDDNVDWVEGKGNRIPVRTWFIHQAGLRFPLNKLLKVVLSLCGLTFMQVSVNFVRTVLAVDALMQREELEFTAEDLLYVYCVVKPRKNSGTQMLEGNHYLHLRKPNQPHTRLVTDSLDKDQYLNDFIWILGQWEFFDGVPDLFSVPRYKGYVPIGFNSRFWRRSDWRSAAISTVNNCGRTHKVSDLLGYAPRPRSSLSDEVSDLFEGTSDELKRLIEEAEGDEGLEEETEVEDGEEVDQIPTAAPLVLPLIAIPPAQPQDPKPILVPSSKSDRADDFAIVEPQKIVKHSYNHSSNSSSSFRGDKEKMALKVKILGKEQGMRDKSAKRPEAPVPALPVVVEDQSIAPSSLEGVKRKGKQPTKGSSQQKKRKGAGSATGTPEIWAPQFIAVEFRKHVTFVDTTKDHETCVALGNVVMLPQDVADQATETTVEFRERFLTAPSNELGTCMKSNLPSFALVFFKMDGSLAWKELGISPDDPTWASPALPVQLPASLRRYSPIILLDFNEEEYATLPADEEDVNIAVVEVRAGIEETAEDGQDGAEGDRDGEAEGENLV
ncbi:hypothetical protein Acr_07g0011370 [Actinidia rufa]|uniref:Uncharacterized protein n=1 Tax=Actinidia rufa TaxID=165716 RepID=A0A7J0EWT2_9ERIC|nr:hypothetical protein Acr_07g0011370 [Actinidia rufa]